MKKLLLLLIIGVNLFAVKLLNSDTYTNNNHIDIEFSLNAPYKYSAITTKEGLNHYIFFKDIDVERAKEISRESKQYKFVRIFPDNDGLLVKVREKKDKLNIDISKSKDGYKIKLKIKPQGKYQLGKYKVDPTVGEDVPNLEKNYLISAGFIALLLLIWIIVKLLTKSKNSKNFFVKNGNTALKVEIETQKVIDNQNKIVQIKMGGMIYIVLVGQNNMLLDKFPEKKEEVISKFDANLKSSQKRLNALLN